MCETTQLVVQNCSKLFPSREDDNFGSGGDVSVQIIHLPHPFLCELQLKVSYCTIHVKNSTTYVHQQVF